MARADAEGRRARRGAALGGALAAFVAAGLLAWADGLFDRGERPAEGIARREPLEPREPRAGGEHRRPPVVVAAGDIACPGTCGQDETAALIEEIDPDAVLGLGDFQYEEGTLELLRRHYDPYWGRFKERTYPVNGGSHDFYGTGDYVEYFNDGGPVELEPEGSYSFDLGDWHLIALNSYCFERESCDERRWTEWLRADLESRSRRCTLAYFHQPYWTAPTRHERAEHMRPWIELLHEHGVDVVLQAHHHFYERFAPQAPDDRRDDARGIAAFTVGTGGRSLERIRSVAPNTLASNDAIYGVLKLTLRPGGYDFEFVPEPGRDFGDAGNTNCH